VSDLKIEVREGVFNPIYDYMDMTDDESDFPVSASEDSDNNEKVN